MCVLHYITRPPRAAPQTARRERYPRQRQVPWEPAGQQRTIARLPSRSTSARSEEGRCPECRCHLFAQLVPTPYIMALQMAQAGLTGEMSPEIARTVNGAESARDFVGDHKIHEVLANLRNKRRS